MSKTATTAVSLSDLNLSKQCEKEYEFEYMHPNGSPSGVFISVVGSQSPRVQNWVRKTLNAKRQRDAMMAKRGKDIPVATVEEDDEFGFEAAAIRIVGWRGITEPYSPELALQLAENNAELRSQVFTASNELANFTAT